MSFFSSLYKVADVVLGTTWSEQASSPSSAPPKKTATTSAFSATDSFSHELHPRSFQPVLKPVVTPKPDTETVDEHSLLLAMAVRERSASSVALPKSIEELTHVKSLDSGSTLPQLYRDKDGVMWVAKWGSGSAHAENEYRMNRAYAALGIEVPPATLLQTTAPNPASHSSTSSTEKHVVYLHRFEPGTTLWKLYEAAVEGGTGSKAERVWKDACTKVQSGFVADSLLGNGDVVGPTMSNTIITDGGTASRIDVGEGLSWKAQGHGRKKPTSVVWQIDAYRDSESSKHYHSGMVFDGIGSETIVAQVRDLGSRKSELLKWVPSSERALIESRIKYLEDRFLAPLDVLDGQSVLTYGEDAYNPFFLEQGTKKPRVIGGGDIAEYAYRGVQHPYTRALLFGDKGTSPNVMNESGFETGLQGLRPRHTSHWRHDRPDSILEHTDPPKGKTGNGVGRFNYTNDPCGFLSFSLEFSEAAKFGADHLVAQVRTQDLNAINVEQRVHKPGYHGQRELTSVGGVGPKDILLAAHVDVDGRVLRIDYNPKLVAAAKRGNRHAVEVLDRAMQDLTQQVSRAVASEQASESDDD